MIWPLLFLHDTPLLLESCHYPNLPICRYSRWSSVRSILYVGDVRMSHVHVLAFTYMLLELHMYVCIIVLWFNMAPDINYVAA